MSARNGNRSAHHVKRKAAIKRRLKTQALRASLKKAPAK